MARLVIVAPVMPPVPGGGGVYYSLMREELIVSGAAESVTVLTERLPARYPLSSAGEEGVLRVLPPKHSQPRVGPRWFLGAALQAIELGRLQRVIEPLHPTHIVVHSAFHNRPTGIGRLLKTIESLPTRPLLVCDVRDPLLPRSRFRTLDPYDLIIACSENVAHRLADLPRPERVARVPIPVSQIKPTPGDIENVLGHFGLKERSYLFNASGLQRRKGLFKTLQAVERLWERGSELPLVVVGSRRVPTRQIRPYIQRGLLQYLGPVPQPVVLALAVGAALDVNFSAVDSMPRHTLEALAAGARVTLPPGVPEFLPQGADWVVPEGTAEAGDFLERMLVEYRQPPYDVARHEPTAVFREFGTHLGIGRNQDSNSAD